MLRTGSARAMKGRIVFAIIAIAIGIAWMLDLAGRPVFPGGISTWWPSIVIAIGIVQLIFSRGKWRGPFVIVLLGLALQAWELDIIPRDFWRFLAPAALILLGLIILLPPYRRSSRPAQPESPRRAREPIGPEDVAVFAQRHIAPTGEYKGGELTAVFGRLEADLTKATLPEGGARVKATSVFADLAIRVPTGWRVQMHGTPVLGQTVMRASTTAGGPRLDIEAVAVGGNVEVIN